MMDERDLERLAARLGEAAAERVDPDEMADAVVARLRSEPAARVRPWLPPRVLRIAAVAVLVVGAGLFARHLQVDRLTREAVLPTPPALLELEPVELAEVFDSLQAEAPVAELMEPSLDDLSEAQLKQLLASMEG